MHFNVWGLKIQKSIELEKLLKTKEELAQMPTLLDIVNHYLDGEQRIEELHEAGILKDTGNLSCRQTHYYQQNRQAMVQ